jgi:hypothetical protein
MPSEVNIRVSSFLARESSHRKFCQRNHLGSPPRLSSTNLHKRLHLTRYPYFDEEHDLPATSIRKISIDNQQGRCTVLFRHVVGHKAIDSHHHHHHLLSPTNTWDSKLLDSPPYYLKSHRRSSSPSSFTEAVGDPARSLWYTPKQTVFTSAHLSGVVRSWTLLT